mmetsp:Transcript_44475/g.105409  ORF Transcript_44475/g.105409 Transcript_44475/m.105409 type:complete len:212 (-) Transcript_44475:86-721(-)
MHVTPIFESTNSSADTSVLGTCPGSMARIGGDSPDMPSARASSVYVPEKGRFAGSSSSSSPTQSDHDVVDNADDPGPPPSSLHVNKFLNDPELGSIAILSVRTVLQSQPVAAAYVKTACNSLQQSTRLLLTSSLLSRLNIDPLKHHPQSLFQVSVPKPADQIYVFRPIGRSKLIGACSDSKKMRTTLEPADGNKPESSSSTPINPPNSSTG